MTKSYDLAAIESTTPSALALAELKSKIISDWERSVRREIGAATHVERPVLIDTLPAFLDNLVQALAEEHPRQTATEGTNIPEVHGGERARLTNYDPGELVREYQILRDLVFDYLQPRVTLTERDRRIIRASFDLSIRDAIRTFFEIHRALREQFVASLTHDLRQPLNVAKMSAELLDGAPPDQVKALAERIVGSVNRADRMIRDLLDVVAGMGQPLKLTLGDCEALKLVRQVVAELETQQQALVRIVGETTYVCWDENAVQRAIHNLLSNAFKYGAVNSPVTVDIKNESGRTRVSVHNLGPSIPKEDQQIMFEPFRRAAKARQSGKVGWGIGLALVRAVAEAHGGGVIVDSVDAHGTSFQLDLPKDARAIVAKLESFKPEPH